VVKEENRDYQSSITIAPSAESSTNIGPSFVEAPFDWILGLFEIGELSMASDASLLLRGGPFSRISIAGLLESPFAAVVFSWPLVSPASTEDLFCLGIGETGASFSVAVGMSRDFMGLSSSVVVLGGC
jgi:hypothetical protein